MHWACQEANPEIVKLLVEFKADIELPNGKGGSPLMLSLNESRSEDKLEILRTLIKARVDINTMDSRGMSPLNKACHDESPGAVQLLLEAEGGTRSINRACMQGTHPVSHSRGQRGVTSASRHARLARRRGTARHATSVEPSDTAPRDKLSGAAERH